MKQTKNWLKRHVSRRKGEPSQDEPPRSSSSTTPTPTPVPQRESSATSRSAAEATIESTGQSTPAEGVTLRAVTTGDPSTEALYDLQETRGWWKEHRDTILASTQFVFEIIEKGLDGMPIPGPKAAFGAIGGVVKAIRTTHESHENLESIAQRIGEITRTLSQFTVPSSPGRSHAFTSLEAASRVEEFNVRLVTIRNSVSQPSVMTKSVLGRLMEAERVAQQLKGAWEEIQREWSRLIAVTVLTTERKVNEVQRRLLLDCLRPAQSAFHDSAEAAPPCLENTRTTLLAEVATWMADPSLKPIFWVQGVAGSGKSAIARSVATHAKDQQCLLGSFFFSRTGSIERRDASPVIPTIVYQLALAHDLFCSRLCSAIDTEPDIRWKPTSTQVKTLICDTLKDIPHAFSRPLLVVIDAFDECEKKDDREGGSLIPDLLAALQVLPFPVKLFITSRQTPSIENMFRRIDFRDITIGFALHRDVDQDVVRSDIGRYLRYQFNQLAFDRCLTIPPPFPLDSEFVELVDRAGNLFIYARTVVQYVSRSAPSPRYQLKLLLGNDSRKAFRRFQELDLLYKHVLTEALNTCEIDGIEQQHVCDVLGLLVVLQENMLVDTVAILTSTEVEDCTTIIRSLSSVLLCDDLRADAVRMMHPSFPDFLADSKRCGDASYAVNVSQYHRRLAQCCLQILNQSLRQNMIDIENPSLTNSEVPDFQQRLARSVSPQLRYACRFWHVHMRLADDHLSVVNAELEVFCTRHLLHWLEQLSLIDELPTVSESMELILNHLRNTLEFRGSHVIALLTDLKQLIWAYRVPVRSRALQVYHSALVTAPLCQLLETPQLDGLPILVSERNHSWASRGKPFEATLGWMITLAILSPDGKLVALGHDNGALSVWDTYTGQEMEITSGEADAPLITALAFSPDGRIIAVGSTNNTVQTWDVMTGEAMHRMIGHEDIVSVAAFSPNGILITTGSHDNTVRVWDATAGQEKHALIGHVSKVLSVAFSLDGVYVASGSCDTTARVWKASTGEEICKMIGHDDAVCSVAFSSNMTSVVSSSWDRTVRIWDAQTGEEKHRIMSTGVAKHVGFSSSGNNVICGSVGNTVQFWDTQVGEETHRKSIPDRSIESVVLLPDEQMIVLSRIDRHIVRVSLVMTSQGGHNRANPDQDAVRCIAFSPDGQVVASGSEDSMLTIWNARTGQQQHKLTGHDSPVRLVALSPNGMWAVSVGDSSSDTARLWDLKSGESKQLRCPHKWICCVAFAPDSKSLGWGCSDGTLQVLNTVGSDEDMLQIAGLESALGSVAFSPDGMSIVAGALFGTMGVWDTQTATEKVKMTGHTVGIASVTFSPDGKLVASGSLDHTICIWDIGTGEQRTKILGKGFPIIQSVAFSSDGQAIIGKHASGTVRFWDTSTGVQLDYSHEMRSQPIFKLDDAGWLWRMKPTLVWQRLCWLPVERRWKMFGSEHIVSHGQTVAIGAESGMVTILDCSQVNVL